MMIEHLRCLADEIAEELEGAEHYGREAVRHKDSHPAIAKKYIEMSEQEADHAEGLYEIGCEMMEGDEDESRLKAMWTTWAKPMMDDKLVKIRIIHSMAK